MKYLALEGTEVKEFDDLNAYIAYCDELGHEPDRIVARTEKDDVLVSTVLLPTNHNFNGEPPHIFETMIFGGRFSEREYQTRCSTYAEALEMHKAAVAIVDLLEHPDALSDNR